MKVAAALVLASALLSAPALADERYSNDDLCRAIGETPKVTVQPRDRLFLEKNCVCFGHGLGCMEKGGAKATSAAVTVAKLDEQERTEAAAREDAKRKAAEAEKTRRASQAQARVASEGRAVTACGSLSDAYWTCARTPGRECTGERDGLTACCAKAGVTNQTKCIDLFP